MKLCKLIFSLLLFLLGLTLENLKSEIIVQDEIDVTFLDQSSFQFESSETEWLGLLYLKEEFFNQGQSSFLNFSSEILILNFSGEVCSKNRAFKHKTRKKELVDEDALDGFVTKLSDDAVGDVAKKKDLVDALSLDNVSAEEFSVFGKLANDNPKLLTKEYFEEVRGILKHKGGEKLVNSWKTLENAGVDKAIRNNVDELTKLKSFQTKNPSKNTNDLIADIRKEGGFDNWKNSLKGFQDIQWKNGKAIWKKKKLAEHYDKHVIKQKEFGDIKQNEFHDLMKSFLDETGEFTQARLGNQLLKYDPITKRIIIGHAKNKEILSFYKALPQYTKVDPWTDAVNEAISKTGLTI